MLIIGLTGGIGSGKSAAASAFESLGAFVVDADLVARDVVEPGTRGLAEIVRHFGDGILDVEGHLERRRLREIVFKNPDERIWLEGLLHPEINRELARRIDSSDAPYAVLVSPLLLEGKQREMVHRIAVVDCDEETQIERTRDRDRCSEDQVRRIMQAQLKREERLRSADDVIRNDADLEYLRAQVQNLHSAYLNLASNETQTES